MYMEGCIGMAVSKPQNLHVGVEMQERQGTPTLHK